MPAVNRSLTRRLSSILYSLKRSFGGVIDIYQIGDATTDTRTGVKTIPKTSITIDRAIILPAKAVREAIQSISVISANKKFVYGGTYDSTVRLFIVDKKDVPTLELRESDYIVYNDRKYEIKDFQEFEFDAGWTITAKAVLGIIPEKIFRVAAENFFNLTQSIGPNTLNVIHGVSNILHDGNEVIYNA